MGSYREYYDDVCRIDKCVYCKAKPGKLGHAGDAKNILDLYHRDTAEQCNHQLAVRAFKERDMAGTVPCLR